MTRALKRYLRGWIAAGLSVLLVLGLSWGWHTRPAAAEVLISRLPQGNAITDGNALLRYALPIENEPVRKLQATLEDISTPLRMRKRLSSLKPGLTQVERILTDKQAALLASIPDERKPDAGFIINQMLTEVGEMRAAIEANDKEALWEGRSRLLSKVGRLEDLMVAGFPYEVPEEYSNLPQLKGRATVVFKTSKGDITAVVDGYSAPVTAGNFVDLVQRGFYDKLPFTRAEESYVLQIGDPPGDAIGFIDPKTKQIRTVPLEVRVQGDELPTYGITLEDAGRFLEQPVLPFSAYGALAMAHSSESPNDGSSQFFFFLFDRELTPPGANLLDGRYAVFGYVVDGEETLGKLKAGDTIESARVVSGLDHLVQPKV